MSMLNRLANVNNPYQGSARRVLCVCSAGLLRSPTTAVVLANEPFNYNTRAAGTSDEFALVPVDQALLTWANEIVCMQLEHFTKITALLNEHNLANRSVTVLDIPDNFPYRDPVLMKIIKDKYLEAHKGP